MSELLCGYKHLFLISDHWHKVIRTPFYNWYSKNWNSESSKAIRHHWGIGNHHLQRESSYKGTKDDEKNQVIKIPFPAGTGAGLITLLGILGQSRGLANGCQEGAIKVIQRMCSCMAGSNFTIRLLPGWNVRVIECMVQMDSFWGHFGDSCEKPMKQRYLD